jgi:hypothetical protein
MKLLAFAASFVLLACVSQADAQPVPTPKGFALMTVIQTRRDQVGDHYSYIADTQAHTTRNGVTTDVAEHQEFGIDIVAVDATGVTIRVVQTKVEDTPAHDDSPGELLQRALTGIQVDYAAGSNGYPVRITNEDQVKTQLVTNFGGLTAQASAQAPNLKQWLDQKSDAELLELFGGKLVMLAAMNFRGVIPMGHKDLPSESHQDADGTTVQVRKTVDVSIAPGPPCRVLVQRNDWTERPGDAPVASSSLKTDATLSELDGWAIELTEVSKNVAPTFEQTRTVRISRQMSQGCPR